MWVIGYGSLIYKPPPFTQHKVSGYLTGFIRRFWQSSSDHRGTPESPGRVVTLIPSSDLQRNPDLMDTYHDPAHLHVSAVAYYIAPENVAEVSDYLNVREQDGYSIHHVPFYVSAAAASDPELSKLLASLPIHPETGEKFIQSMIYIGTIDNESFVGPESMEQTATVIRTSVGPLGPNVEYLVNLHEAVKELAGDLDGDAYLKALVECVKS
ncbi:hypothetical protein BABINDRAFT_38570 [Babjeviella inositovora NRRL Y-12698]|uniref:glutathione-specific gamma-glutamylcyclotransferase n=1 Tax=Babjeviella inositovora NRRL Y-12698 TaxID=984486 RepID=A0A1E3QMZ9_9ASCO|nr:uncharacterized protein BABINDRAFT_38570 [Babjeviella inositovora NRRL Y-12698]ODQ78834.1 hypothetical protein BABINDRAFT_38570 [Babjeviella inositovora NRRL Y-12698]